MRSLSLAPHVHTASPISMCMLPTATAVTESSGGRVESSLDVCSRRRTRCTTTTAPDDGTRHPQMQSSAGTDKWVLSWRLNEASDSSGDRRAVGSRFQVLGPYAAKMRWPVDVRVQGCTRRRLQSETGDDRP